MKKIISVILAVAAICVMCLFISTTASAEISPTAVTFTHREGDIDNTTVTGGFTRPGTTVPGGNIVPGGNTTTKWHGGGDNTVPGGNTPGGNTTRRVIPGTKNTTKGNITSDKSPESPNTAATSSFRILAVSVASIASVAYITLRKKEEITK